MGVGGYRIHRNTLSTNGKRFTTQSSVREEVYFIALRVQPKFLCGILVVLKENIPFIAFKSYIYELARPELSGPRLARRGH